MQQYVTESPYWRSYCEFHRAAVETHDVDPVYPVLKRVGELRDWDADTVVRGVFMHVAYYHLGSALYAMDCGARAGLPIGVERRGNRDPVRLRKHLEAVDEWLGRSPADHIHAYLEGDPWLDFDTLVEALKEVYGNGRWAAYKTAEMLEKVADYPIRASTMSITDSSGPAAGLAILAPGVAVTEAAAGHVVGELIKALDTVVDPAEVETTLCDFHALFDGRYYVGHDIDVMLAQLAQVPATPSVKAALAARRDVFARAYLGEVGGWSGPNAARRKLYRMTGQVVLR